MRWLRCCVPLCLLPALAPGSSPGGRPRVVAAASPLRAVALLDAEETAPGRHSFQRQQEARGDDERVSVLFWQCVGRGYGCASVLCVCLWGRGLLPWSRVMFPEVIAV